MVTKGVLLNTMITYTQATTCTLPMPQHNFPPPGPGYVVNAHPTYPVLHHDTHGQLWLSTPLDNRFHPHLSPVPTYPSMPSNTMMPTMPLDGRFHAQLPPSLSAYLDAPFDPRTHPVWTRGPTYVPFVEPQ